VTEEPGFFLVCFCSTFAGDPPTGHKPGEPGCISASPPGPDPLADTRRGEAFNAEETTYLSLLDANRACREVTFSGPNVWNKVECDRLPHPKEWAHIAVVDDRVEYVWRKLQPAEINFLVLTDQGVACGFCGWDWTTSREHSSGCQFPTQQQAEPSES
jgi:hypothetical protein